MEDRGLFLARLVVAVAVGLGLGVERLGRSARRTRREHGARHAEHVTRRKSHGGHSMAQVSGHSSRVSRRERARRPPWPSWIENAAVVWGAVQPAKRPWPSDTDVLGHQPTHMGQLVLLLRRQLEVLEEEDGVLRGSAGLQVCASSTCALHPSMRFRGLAAIALGRELGRGEVGVRPGSYEVRG
jgi:hypothetical protein